MLVIAKAVDDARNNISGGIHCWSLWKIRSISPIVIHMVTIGEKTGELENMLTQDFRRLRDFSSAQQNWWFDSMIGPVVFDHGFSNWHHCVLSHGSYDGDDKQHSVRLYFDLLNKGDSEEKFFLKLQHCCEKTQKGMSLMEIVWSFWRSSPLLERPWWKRHDQPKKAKISETKTIMVNIVSSLNQILFGLWRSFPKELTSLIKAPDAAWMFQLGTWFPMKKRKGIEGCMEQHISLWIRLLRLSL